MRGLKDKPEYEGKSWTGPISVFSWLVRHGANDGVGHFMRYWMGRYHDADWGKL